MSHSIARDLDPFSPAASASRAAIRAHSSGVMEGATPGTHSLLDLMVIEQRARDLRDGLEFIAIAATVALLGSAIFIIGGAF